LFASAFVASNFFYGRRLREVDSLERQITRNLLSSEIQFDLLAETPCDADGAPLLGRELTALASRLEYLESARGRDDDEVRALREQYSLLQIRDLLLVKDIARQCGDRAYTVVYFYSNEPGACAECAAQGFVLSALREEHPRVRVYSFDADLSLGAVEALKEIYRVEDLPLPVLVVDRVAYAGFREIDEVRSLLPGLAAADAGK
jgi:hypothetical protein